MVALASLDRAESGRDQVSLHLALLAMTNNIGYAVAVGIVNGLLQLFHYQAGAPEGNATWAVIGLGLVLPAFFFIARSEVRRVGEEGVSTCSSRGWPVP